jgi:hypothetical protein
MEESAFIDPFLLTLTLIVTIMLILGNLYFLAHYSHHADSGFGSSTAVKFIIVSKIVKFANSNPLLLDDLLYDSRMLGHYADSRPNKRARINKRGPVCVLANHLHV